MADYAISNVPRRVVYAASGVGPYAFTFEILNQTDIAVYKASTLLTLTTDYTVTINANGTGSVTLVLTAGTSNITIVGAKNIQRTTDFTTGGDLFANTLNDELDNQTIFIQQVAETAERGLKAPVVDPTDINMTLPAKASRVGTVLAFNASTGNPEAGPSIGSVTTVAAQSANINTVATNIASVNTVAGNIANVNTVAGISADVTMVATFQFNVNTVADDLNEPTSEINTVAVDIANVNAVGTNISNVNTVAGNNANVTTVAGISGNVTTVAGVAAGVTTVAGISSNVTTVAGVAANVTTVAGISSNVTAVANNNANVTTVAGSIANVNNVGNNISNVNLNAANIVAIQNAADNAAQAQISESAAVIAASAASASAAAASAVALGNEPVRHSVRPSLLLDFANTKTLDPRITYTRASAGTYYDGKTVAKAEENLVIRSQEFDNAIWTKNNATVTANSVAAPDGTTTAETIVETTGNGGHGIYQTVSGNFIAGQYYTMSFYAKLNSAGRYVVVSFLNGINTFLSVVLDPATGVLSPIQIGSTTGFFSNYSATSTSAGNGWYRVALTTRIDTAFSQTANFFVSTTATVDAGYFGATQYTGDGTSSVYMWGAQLEQRSTVTAYTPTTTAPITNYVPVLLSAPANVARFEHNPVTGESLGLEIEEQRTNLLLRSEEYDNASWVKAAGVTVAANTNIAPDGTLTADTVTSGANQIDQSVVCATSTVYTDSLYFKKTTGVAYQAGMYLFFSGGTAVIYAVRLDTNTGVATAVAAGGFTAPSAFSVFDAGGYWRLSITGNSNNNTSAVLRLYANLNSGGGAGAGSQVIWGAQLEAGAFATSYIPTVASQVTRSADSASMTGTNFSSWYRADEGTLYGDAIAMAAPTDARVMVEVGDGTLNNRMTIGKAGALNQSNTTVVTFGALQAQIVTLPAFVPNVNSKATLTYKVNDFASSSDGGTAGTDTSGLIPVVNRLEIGATTTGIARWNGYYKKLAYYPKRLSNAEITSLTVI